ncbi:hypothetical protein FIV00_03130 [Labrenzia sp. THAF82]|uniref:hypothetical protein n=1 Tax=Labrenzia sp. THAF82 TaxID=2587861 RepID=UPI001268452F|nr:hypothetical protein [Labrenzia sp. THAF82]QFT29466.1 hypothetical protein FIV00_03130 [Labrenzia sp. THAF82]
MPISFENFGNIVLANRERVENPKKNTVRLNAAGDLYIDKVRSTKSFLGRAVSWIRSLSSSTRNSENKTVRMRFRSFLADIYGPDVGAQIYNKTCYSRFSLRWRPLTVQKIQNAVYSNSMQLQKNIDVTKALTAMQQIAASFEKEGTGNRLEEVGVFRVPGLTDNMNILEHMIGGDRYQVNWDVLKATDMSNLYLRFGKDHTSKSVRNYMAKKSAEYETWISENGKPEEFFHFGKFGAFESLPPQLQLHLKVMKSVVSHTDKNLMGHNMGRMFNPTLFGPYCIANAAERETFISELVKHYIGNPTVAADMDALDVNNIPIGRDEVTTNGDLTSERGGLSRNSLSESRDSSVHSRATVDIQRLRQIVAVNPNTHLYGGQSSRSDFEINQDQDLAELKELVDNWDPKDDHHDVAVLDALVALNTPNKTND